MRTFFTPVRDRCDRVSVRRAEVASPTRPASVDARFVRVREPVSRTTVTVRLVADADDLVAEDYSFAPTLALTLRYRF